MEVPQRDEQQTEKNCLVVRVRKDRQQAHRVDKLAACL